MKSHRIETKMIYGSLFRNSPGDLWGWRQGIERQGDMSAIDSPMKSETLDRFTGELSDGFINCEELSARLTTVD